VSGSRTWHIVTSEYPPQLGGVSDFAAVAASVLLEQGEEVHVWTGGESSEIDDSGVLVHRTFGEFDGAGLRRTSLRLDETPGPRTLLVQWVPHGYSPRGMNLRFARWLSARARAGDRLLLVVHEPFLSEPRRPSHLIIAAVQRVMAAIVLRRTEQVFVTIPAWERSLRGWALGRKLPWKTIPLPPAIPVQTNVDDASLRSGFAEPAQLLIGHFGACGGPMRAMLQRTIPPLLHAQPNAVALLIGRDSEEMRERLVAEDPDLRNRVKATGALSIGDASLHLQACDLFVQPYPDGVSGRRTSVIAALSHGKAVVTTSGHLTEDFWKRSGAVALVNVDDTAAMVVRTQELLRDSFARRKLEQRAKSFCDEQFSRARLGEVLTS
jgi:hypothetical protein